MEAQEEPDEGGHPEDPDEFGGSFYASPPPRRSTMPVARRTTINKMSLETKAILNPDATTQTVSNDVKNWLQRRAKMVPRKLNK
jgi:hypothetical protein